ncbi:hypothetical protein GCM10010170_041220 [Dactylosporangium salmoneum]|uniref:Uncharacterized protein n=1 Tax=Dactylosporangium salmoneum TaxID=53361 RepID=A0ABN3GGQ7_9ACTN
MTSAAGVTSNAGLTASVPAGAAPTTSADPRSSISTSAPDAVSRSTVDSGATQMNGMPAAHAPSACEYVPTLFTTSPLAQIRSAPRITASTSPRAIRNGPAESTASRCGTPARPSSHVVSRAPCSSGRVSLAMTLWRALRRYNSNTTAKAVPSTTVASPPALQCVRSRMPLPHSVSTRSAPSRAIAAELAISSSRMRKASASTASKDGNSAAARRAPRARFTAVGRAVSMRRTA